MKAKVTLSSFLFLSIANLNIFAQGEAAVWFLTFPISPSQNSMSYTGTSLPIDDPYGFLLNPAQLGYTSKSKNFSFMYYPSTVKLWNMNQFQIKGSAFNIGYNFEEIVGFPISVGFGFANQELTLDYSDFFPTVREFQDKDSYNAYAIGVGINYYIQFNTGITFKNINSTISNPFPITPVTFEAKGNTFDFGFLLNMPALKLIDEDISFSVLNKKPLKPFLNISFGYSKFNIGDKIYYIDPAQADPLPRTARLGYGISAGVDIVYEDYFLRFIGIDFTVDAEDLLLKFKTESDSLSLVTRFDGYHSFIGDIEIGKNIIQIKGDDNIIVHAGIQFNLLDSFIFKWGHVKGNDPLNRTTTGFEIRSSGVLKFLDNQIENSIIKFISNHFDLRYYNSIYALDSELETKFSGLALYVHNLNSLF